MTGFIQGIKQMGCYRVCAQPTSNMGRDNTLSSLGCGAAYPIDKKICTNAECQSNPLIVRYRCMISFSNMDGIDSGPAGTRVSLIGYSRYLEKYENTKIPKAFDDTHDAFKMKRLAHLTSDEDSDPVTLTYIIKQNEKTGREEVIFISLEKVR